MHPKRLILRSRSEAYTAEPTASAKWGFFKRIFFLIKTNITYYEK